MGLHVDIPGVIEDVTVYTGGTLVARRETVTLPEVTRMTFTQKIPGGDQDFPTNLLEDMETSVTKNGLNENLFKFVTEKNIEYRWVQTITDSAGTVKREGYKAFLTTMPITLQPGVSIEPGSATENDVTKKVLAYTLYRNGACILDINKVTGKQIVNGVNYSINESML